MKNDWNTVFGPVAWLLSDRDVLSRRDRLTVLIRSSAPPNP
jgi:hypothetical protein